MLDANPDPIEELLATCLRERGKARADALARACAEQPEFGSELRRRLAVLEQFGFDGLCAEEIDAFGKLSAATQPQRFGDFELLELLGIGGMGVVYRARQTSLDRVVVVKLVRPELCHFPHTRERFRREAEAAAHLKHPGIVPVHAVGEHENVPFFVMEEVEGLSLADCLEGVAGLAPESLRGHDLAPALARTGSDSWVMACLDVAIQVADALDYVAHAGLLHRDVKPSNILLTAEGRARLIDFGLHALAEPDGDGPQDEGRLRLTQEGQAPGTLLYMPPEVLESGRYDARSEVYSLGATLYELLTLQPPFHGSSRSDTERRIRQGQPDAICPRNRAVRPDVDAVVRKAMALEPSRRYLDVAAFARDLRCAMAGLPVAARPDSGLYRLRRWVGREPALASASAALLLLLVVVPIIVIVLQNRHAHELQLALDDESAARTESDDLTILLADLFATADPDRNEPQPATVALLGSWVQTLEERLPSHPRRQARMLSLLGRLHSNLGLFADGKAILMRALLAFDTAAPDVAPEDRVAFARERSEARVRLTNLLERAGDLEGVLVQIAPLIAELSAGYGPDHWHVAVTRADQLRLCAQLKRALPGESEPPTSAELNRAMRAALAVVEAADDTEAWQHARITGWLGSTLVGRAMELTGAEQHATFEEAAQLLERTRTLLAEAGRGRSLDWALASNALGLARKKLGDLDAAERHYHEVLAFYEKRLEPTDSRLAVLYINLAGIDEARGSLATAVTSYEKALTMLLATEGPDAQLAVLVEGNLLGDLMQLRQTEGLLERYDALLPRQIAIHGERGAVVGSSYERRGMLRFLGKDKDGARADFEKAIELLGAVFGQQNQRVAQIRKLLASFDRSK